ncbi:hypothetical protein OPV22_005433 [Ensete ventricosum]|uniref:Uncharacterized protein n=1 Tax=Ensete ventricosum TaxID=4639 RepID=A0AAV8Q936_ENSVE|nr:hypothetical protein OPV22_005433 [Ensete ventricosum]
MIQSSGLLSKAARKPAALPSELTPLRPRLGHGTRKPNSKCSRTWAGVDDHRLFIVSVEERSPRSEDTSS